jgi:hypothetical protein
VFVDMGVWLTEARRKKNISYSLSTIFMLQNDFPDVPFHYFIKCKENEEIRLLISSVLLPSLEHASIPHSSSCIICDKAIEISRTGCVAL